MTCSFALKRFLVVWLCGTVLGSASPVLGQTGRSGPPAADVGAPAAETGPPVDVEIRQRLNESVPLDLSFVDETGRSVRLGDYFQDKPVVLSLVYYECPMLCTLVLNGLTTSLKYVKYEVPDDFLVLTVSIDPDETPELAAAKKVTYLEEYGRAGGREGWHFLTGEPEAIEALAEAVGFRYVYDPESGQYAHASGIMVLTPEGRLARYFYGVDYPARDMQFALMEASEGRIGSLADQLLLLCYQYDPTTGTYTAATFFLLRVVAVITVLALGTSIYFMRRRESGPARRKAA